MTSPTRVSERSWEIYRLSRVALDASTDRLFGYLLACEYLVAVIWAIIRSPLTWEGRTSFIHPHVWTAVLLGGLIAVPTIVLTYVQQGANGTRWALSVTSMLMSALIIHLSDGRIETHFSIFVTLAFLAFYRDWRLLIPATAVVVLDHVVRGIYLPLSIYDVRSGAEWRFLEHGSWVLFEDFVLAAACIRGVQELHTIADRQAQVEVTMDEVEELVEVRTKQLKAMQQHEAAILSHALDGIVSTDASGIIIDVNPAAERKFNLGRAEVVGSQIVGLLIQAPDVAENVRNLPEMLAATHRDYLNKRTEISGLRKGVTPFPAELSIVEIELPEGTSYTAFVRDLTNQKRLESDLTQAQKLESIGQLSAGVAHEINTPNQYIGDNVLFLKESLPGLQKTIDLYRELGQLNAVDHLHSDLLGRIEREWETSDLEFVMDEAPKAIAQALEGVERVGSIVRAMKDFAHPGQDEHVLVDLNKIIQSTVTVSRNEWKYVARVELELAKDLPQVNGHPSALGQVILNLIVNSVHAIKERFGKEQHGQILISTQAVEGAVQIKVSDNGCGIKESAQDHVFEAFYTTKRVGVGTGQGLAISHSVICEKHKGEISFTTAPDEGTTFTILLPISGGATVAAGTEAA